MERKQTDSFEESQRIHETDNTNFFLSKDAPRVQKFKSAVSEPSRRLNDYDFNLLKEDAYKDVSDDLFKLEYKISKVEGELKNLESQLQAAEDILDYNLIEELNNRKKILTDDYEALLDIYNEKSVSARISDGFSNVFGERIQVGLNVVKQHFSTFSDTLVQKMPKRFATIFELKKSLNKLENINKSVDELVNLNIPYGENIDKYEQLSKYIIKANAIQAEISQYLKK